MTEDTAEKMTVVILACVIIVILCLGIWIGLAIAPEPAHAGDLAHNCWQTNSPILTDKDGNQYREVTIPACKRDAKGNFIEDKHCRFIRFTPADPLTSNGR